MQNINRDHTRFFRDDKMLFALSALMLVLGILRVLAVRYLPEKV